jgi:hypothetical protein
LLIPQPRAQSSAAASVQTSLQGMETQTQLVRIRHLT